MIGLIQRVTHADVTIDNEAVCAIGKGILALIGIEKTDTKDNAEKLLSKIIHYRIFPDADDKMNLNLKQIEGGLLLVPQFTLVAETDKGTRPGFSRGMPPADGAVLFDYLVLHAKEHYSSNVASGKFGSNMQVSLCNDGPVTFMLHS